MPHDLRYVLRSIARRKGFALVTVLTLALGIGSATAIYSVVAWHLFRGPPAPPGVYMLGIQSQDGDVTPYVPAAFAERYIADGDVIAAAAWARGQSMNVVVDKEPISSSVTEVSATFFDELGVTLGAGRTFAPSECLPGRDTVAIVSYGFWKSHLGGLPSALGARLRVGGDIVTVIGVLRQGQRLPSQASAEVYRPGLLDPVPGDPFASWSMVFVRLRPGVAPRQAEAALRAVKPDVPAPMRDYAEKLRAALTTVADSEKYLHRELYWALVGAVGFLYGIACLNAANLLLVHLFGRRREISIRAALGGGRLETLRLIGLESAFLALGGALLGAWVANGMGPLFYALAGHSDPNHSWLTWNLGGPAYAVLGGLCLATTLLTTAAPAVFLLRMNLNEGLKGSAGAVGESPALARTRSAFVVLQAAFAVILLVGAGLMIRTFQRLEHLRLGFETAQRVKIDVSPIPLAGKLNPDAEMAKLEGIKTALLGVPGVASVAFSSGSLLSGYSGASATLKDPEGRETKIRLIYSSSDYLSAGGITLLSGRWFAPDAKSEVVINETLARRWFPGAHPVGAYVRSSDGKEDKGWQVVGVAADVRETVHEEPLPAVYVPVRWSPNVVGNYIVQLNSKPEARILQTLRAAAYAQDPSVVVWAVRPLGTLLEEQTYQERLTLSVLRVLSAVALALTLVGLFSIVAYTVDQRMGEFGIRMAIGATPGALMLLVLRRSVSLTLMGVLLGVAGAMGLTRFINALLYEAPAFDGVVVASVAALLVLSGVAACLLPARKAAKPDLATLLRQSE
jgi:putative ABC transport system permease protein